MTRTTAVTSRFLRRAGRRVSLLGALLMFVVAAAALTTPAAAEPSTNPFDEAVGGKLLGTTGKAVYTRVPGVKPPPNVEAAAWLVADLDSGEVLAAKNAHRRLRPASTLKMLTAATLLPRLDKNAVYTATAGDQNIEGSRVGIEAGSAYTIDQLFYGLFLPSGNDAAHALASASGGVKATVAMMNTEAQRLGAFDTHAVNPSGLDEPGQLSSAYDLALIAREGMANPDFVRYATTPTYDFPGRKGKTFQIQNTNRLLSHYRGAIGVKNGYTSKARNTLVGAAERGGRRLLVVVLKCGSPSWEKAADLLDWGFASAGSAKPIGHLVTADEVSRARTAASRSRTATASASPTPTPTPTVQPTRSPASQPTTLPATSGFFDPGTLWLIAAGGLFVVLASMRVAVHVRSKRRPQR